MYTNSKYNDFKSSLNEIKLQNMKLFIKEIDDFYKFINTKYDKCVARYQDAVKAILDDFPIDSKMDTSGDYIYYIKGHLVEDTDRITKALLEYIQKFESIKYLDFLSEEKRNVVFVGPNGSGKTTLLRKLKKDTANAKMHYYPADRVLLVSDNFSPKRNHDEFLKEYNANYSNSTNIEYVHQGLEIYKQLSFCIDLLERERNQENETGTDNRITQRIIDKWKELVKDRELYFEYGLCVRPIGGESYPLKYLSSGEKSILYFLVGILLQEEKDYYFIDEPENNLNPAIVSKLWDFIERERPNSVFIYLTHDSEFVASRINAKIYWIEKFDGINWEWKLLKENKDLPQDLMIKLMGNREPVLFCESHDEYKYDAQLFKLLFPEYKVVSSAGCDKVCSSVKAYKEVGLPQEAIGIIDCDYKTEEYLEGMKANGIYHIPYHEIENFLCSEKIITAMINEYCSESNKEEIFIKVKEEVKKLFEVEKEKWIAKHVAFELKDKFDYRGKVKSLNNLQQFKELYSSERQTNEEIDAIAQRYEDLFNDVIEKDDYNLYLRYLDYKGILTKFSHILKLGDDIEYEIEVLQFLNSSKGSKLIKELRAEYFPEI